MVLMIADTFGIKLTTIAKHAAIRITSGSWTRLSSSTPVFSPYVVFAGPPRKPARAGCQTITKQCSVKSRFCQEVLSYGCRDCGHITYVLHHGCNSDRSHNQDRCHIKFCRAASEEDLPSLRKLQKKSSGSQIRPDW